MLTFHFVTVIAMTVLVSVVVMRRYAASVREGMGSVGSIGLIVAPCRPLERTAPLTVIEVDAASTASPAARTAIHQERVARRRIVAAYLFATGACGLAVTVVSLWVDGVEMIPARLIAPTGAIMGAAVPMIAVSVAWPFWRALLIWIVLELAVALLSVVVPMTGRLLRQGEFDATLAMNALYTLQWTALTMTFPFALAFVTGIRKLRGVAPVSLALISVLGLVPLLGAKGADRLASEENILFQAYGVTMVMYASFFVLAPAAGWVAWRVLKALSNAYDAKRFSDAQLIANVWWLIFVATLIAGLPVGQNGSALVLLLAGATSFALFPVLTGAVLRTGAHAGAHDTPPTLLLLRLFGHTGRSERFFDRVVGRWRLIGPVTVIAAPDILARTFDPVDFLQFVTGRAGQAFVESQQQLERRLSELDLRADPDGRYRVSEFWCRGNTWQATVTALMSSCHAVVVDVRGLTAGRDGVRFELEQLATRVPADRVVLVVDKDTDRALIERSVAEAKGTLRLVRVERNSASETRRVFETLLEAAAAG